MCFVSTQCKFRFHAYCHARYANGRVLLIIVFNLLLSTCGQKSDPLVLLMFTCLPGHSGVVTQTGSFWKLEDD